LRLQLADLDRVGDHIVGPMRGWRATWSASIGTAAASSANAKPRVERPGAVVGLGPDEWGRGAQLH